MRRMNASVVASACLWVFGCGAGQDAASGAGADAGQEQTDAWISGPVTTIDSGVTKHDAGPPVCGDGICNGTETCETCSNDCGQCPSCGLAPSCSLGLSLPSQPVAVDFNSLSAPVDGGFSPTCGDAQLRLRISHIDVGHQGQEVWLPTGTLNGPSESYYAIMQASDGVIVGTGDAGSGDTMEVAITPPTAQVADNSGEDLPVAASIFWGQAGPHLSQGNLSITYSIYQQKSSSSAASAWASILDAGAAAAGSATNAGAYGWAFGLGSVGLSVAAAAAAAAEQQGDWHMFDVTLTIDASHLLGLSNGAVWSFTQSGGNSAFEYPWSITVYTEAWGCASPVAPKPNQ